MNSSWHTLFLGMRCLFSSGSARFNQGERIVALPEVENPRQIVAENGKVYFVDRRDILVYDIAGGKLLSVGTNYAGFPWLRNEDGSLAGPSGRIYSSNMKLNGSSLVYCPLFLQRPLRLLLGDLCHEEGVTDVSYEATGIIKSIKIKSMSLFPLEIGEAQEHTSNPKVGGSNPSGRAS